MNRTMVLGSKIKTQKPSKNQIHYFNSKYHESDSLTQDIVTTQVSEGTNDTGSSMQRMSRKDTFPLTKDSCCMAKSDKFARNLIIYEIPDKEDDDDEYQNVEKSLKEFGFDRNEVKDWDKIVQPKKSDLLQIIYRMIRNHEYTNVQIRIDQTTFCCHMLVLQCYSDFFRDLTDQQIVILPSDKVTPQAFIMIYEWMLQNHPLIQREGILELFTAAKFLKIDELSNQCWACIDDGELICEDTAFMLYLEAREYNHQLIKDLMLNRIGRFFLTVVASKDFLELSSEEICSIFEKNTIGVHSEAEVLLAAVRWLNYDWNERNKHILDITKRVRFGLMLPWQLLEFRRNADTVELERVVGHPAVQKMLDDGFSYVTARYWYASEEEVAAAMERLKLQPPDERLWIRDEIFTKQFECPNRYCITYCSFLDFIKMMKEYGKDYWKNFKYVDRNPILEMKKSHSDVNLNHIEHEYKCLLRAEQQQKL